MAKKKAGSAVMKVPVVRKPAGAGWSRVLFAWECEPCVGCGEPVCAKHRQHYSECPCVGPTEEDYEYRWVGELMWARKLRAPSGSR